MVSNRNYTRTVTFSPTYSQKSNTSNVVLIYNTVGMSMVREIDTF